MEESLILPEYQDSFNKLIEQISLDKCCAFIGSGLSIPAGYPCWVNIITELEKKASKDKSYLPIDHSADYSIQIEELRKYIGEEEYKKIITQLFNPDGKEDYRPIHCDLMRIPFHGFITTNYDLCLENAANSIGKPVGNNWYPELDTSFLRLGYVFHIHGLFNMPDISKTFGSLIISERDYLHAYEDEIDKVLPNFLANLYQFHTIVFLGFSLNDNYLFRAIKNAQAELEDRARFEKNMMVCDRLEMRHFIFAHEKNVDKVVIDKITSIGLNPILYSGEDYRHTDLQRILEKILELTTKVENKPVIPNWDLFKGKGNEEKLL